jgi:hypothetical protein
MVDRRRIARTRISAPALVIPSGGSLVWKCFVRDITSLGARLEFPDAPVLPTDFNLTFEKAAAENRLTLIRGNARRRVE